MHWFGESWEAPVCRDDNRVRIPAGDSCAECGEKVRSGDQGFILPCVNDADEDQTWTAFHRRCMMKNLGLVPG